MALCNDSLAAGAVALCSAKHRWFRHCGGYERTWRCEGQSERKALSAEKKMMGA